MKASVAPATACPTVRVGIVEDDAETRQALRGFLERARAVSCIGAFGTGEEAITNLPALQPDVVIMDVNLPEMNGVQCVRHLATLIPATQIVMLTVFDDTEMIFQALASGAKGYLLKPIRASQLLAAVQDVIAGGAPMTSNIARKVVQAFQPPAPRVAWSQPAQAEAVGARLSPREREVLDLLARGYLYKEIARHFGVSYSTVHTHVERIYQKLHVRSRAQAVAKLFGPHDRG